MSSVLLANIARHTGIDIANGREYWDSMIAFARRSTVRVAPLLFLVLLLLTPMAYASPPDPSWIAGLYDNADFDDVVLSVTSAVGIVELIPLADVSRAPVLLYPFQYSEQPVSAESPDALRSRAPPLGSTALSSCESR